MIPFAKYQALGNDFVVIDARTRLELLEDAELAVRLLDRHRGIGGDDLILLLPSDAADFGMRIRTPSGGWLAMCGNGIRCLSRYARDVGLWQSERLRIETAVGVRETRWLGDPEQLVAADLLAPDLRAAAIPTTLAAPQRTVLDQPLDLREAAGDQRAISRRPMDAGSMSVRVHEGGLPESTSFSFSSDAASWPPTLRVSCVSVGNPHAVFFVADLEAVPMGLVGPAIEHHPAFPEGVNVHAAQVLEPGRARIRTWERGAGLTWA